MAFLLRTEILIHATPEKVWSILSDYANYPNWNPFVTLLEGDVQVGKKIAVRIEPPGAGVNNFKPLVTAVEPYKKLSWLGTVLMKGVFDGEHIFELTDNGNGTTTLVQSEHFKGILVPFFKKQLNDNTRRGFEAMNQQLKTLAEQQ